MRARTYIWLGLNLRRFHPTHAPGALPEPDHAEHQPTNRQVRSAPICVSIIGCDRLTPMRLTLPPCDAIWRNRVMLP